MTICLQKLDEKQQHGETWNHREGTKEEKLDEKQQHEYGETWDHREGTEEEGQKK